MTSFNFKTQPWRIQSCSYKKSRAVQMWLFEQGIRWPDGGGACDFPGKTWFSNVKDGRQLVNHLVYLGREVEHPSIPEIKIHYAGGPLKTRVLSADFPSDEELSAWRASLA